jgi:hypothetical protein
VAVHTMIAQKTKMAFVHVRKFVRVPASRQEYTRCSAGVHLRAWWPMEAFATPLVGEPPRKNCQSLFVDAIAPPPNSRVKSRLSLMALDDAGWTHRKSRFCHFRIDEGVLIDAYASGHDLQRVSRCQIRDKDFCQLPSHSQLPPYNCHSASSKACVAWRM